MLVFAGGKPRFGVLGSALGVHRFVTTKPVGDPVAETQRIAGAVLGYMTKMGVSSSIVEAMSETRDIRWLAPQGGAGHEPHHRSRRKALSPPGRWATCGSPINRNYSPQVKQRCECAQKIAFRRIL